ncbi:MAG: hypothetical protein N4A57_15730 [Anaeromicrobium sp.]|uniref:hypothetical protein n=1 Tax=Anaeromicrobium sp. TaxID=1929132 RepID=UPI0025EDACBF|nr:hypothetical protein [Anaeromicrobium sp.]MCT4595698.1 hypothetical protein [Anaeromicrobium sp.]
MKRKLILIVTLTLAFTTACGGKNTISENTVDEKIKTENKIVEKKVTKSEEEQENIMREFDKVMAEITEKEIIEFVDNNIEGLSEENGTRLVLGIQQVQRRKIEDRVDSFFEVNIQEKMIEKLDDTFTLDKIDRVEDEELKNFLQEIKDSGYNIFMTEGSYYPIEDFEFYKKYIPHVSEDMKEYIELQAIETNNISSSDAALIISWKEVLDRALNHEKFINKYPDFPRVEDIKKQYLFYIMASIFGESNTPAFDYMDERLNEELKESYFSLDLNDTDSKFIQTLKEYIELLEKNNYKLTDEVQEYRNGIYNGFQKELGM